MNRRTLLKGTSGIAASVLLPHTTRVVAQDSPAAGQFPSLTITVRDDGYDIPEGLTAGRYAVSVINAGTTPSHSSLGRLPDGITNDRVIADLSSGSEELPDWFLNAGYVGLPDWPAPGETRTGVVDLSAGNFFMFDPFSDRHALATVAQGGEMGPEPMAQATIEMTEMRFILPGNRYAGPARLKISNIGALPHEFQILAVPEGTSADQIETIFAMPEDSVSALDVELAQGSSMVHIPANVEGAYAAPDDELVQTLTNYAPAAATSILGAGLSSWIDVDLAPGTYAVICALPFPDGVPHAMGGMVEVITLAS